MAVQSRTLTIELPEEVLREAEALGILEPESLVLLIRDEIQRLRDVRRFREIHDALDSTSGEPMTLEEVVEEIHLYRAEKRAKQAAEQAAQEE